MMASRIGFRAFMTAFSSKKVFLSRPLATSFETHVRSFPVLMAFLHLGGAESVRQPPRFPPLKMGFESPSITPEQSRELPWLNLHRTLKELDPRSLASVISGERLEFPKIVGTVS